MSQYERPNIAQMQGYASGEQPEDGRSIKLNTNENPYPPSPSVAAALASFATEQLRIYPQPDARLLRQAIAEHHNVSCLLYTSPSPRDGLLSRMPSSA